MLYGFLQFSFWGDVMAVILLTQLTIASVTIYLHRHQSHRALSLHPLLSHFFRFWLWLTTGMITAQWVAIHRKHHASTDVEGDPHSPKVLGLRKVLWQGSELYRAASKDADMIEKYAHGTPQDWVEHHLYQKFPFLGITLMFLGDLMLFGLPGITIWAIQMIWIPFWAAGVINGIGHHWGYRNFECPDASTNLLPWGLWIGGEELHNNHHTYASSAKFSVKWWEVDIGWGLIRLFSCFGLAKVKKLPPRLVVDQHKQTIDVNTVRAVIANRFQLMSTYYQTVLKPLLKAEKLNTFSGQEKKLFWGASRLFKKEEMQLTFSAQAKLQALLNYSSALQQAYHFRQSLQTIWKKTSASQKDIVDALQDWCLAAEASGLEGLKVFAQQMRSYIPAPHALLS